MVPLGPRTSPNCLLGDRLRSCLNILPPLQLLIILRRDGSGLRAIALLPASLLFGWSTIPPDPVVAAPSFDLKGGIPEEFATFVVMPSMLVRPRRPAERSRQCLETHYLAERTNVRFARARLR